MFIAVVAIVAVLIAGVWTGLDRNAGRAVAGALGCGAILAGFAVALGGEDTTATVLLGAAAMAGAVLGIAVGRVLRPAFASGADRLRIRDDPRGHGPEKRLSRTASGTADAGAERMRIQGLVRKARESAASLVASNVQLIDLSRLLEPAEGRAGMGRDAAMQIAEATARGFLKPEDLMVRAGAEGLIILFDGVGLAEAEAKSEAIADAITEALGAGDADCPFMAKGFAYELDSYMQEAMIDSVDDLIRVVKLAHQAYVMKEKGLAKALDRELQLDIRPVVRPGDLSVIGHEARVARLRMEANGRVRTELSFSKQGPSYGAEIDCAAVLKLASAIRNIERGRDHTVFLPIRFDTLAHPLYLDNLADALAGLPRDIRARLVCVLLVDRTSAPPKLVALVKGLRRFAKGVLIHPRHPYRDLEAVKQTGLDGLALHAAAFAGDGGREALAGILGEAKRLEVFSVVFGAGTEMLRDIKVPYSSAGT